MALFALLFVAFVAQSVTWIYHAPSFSPLAPQSAQKILRYLSSEHLVGQKRVNPGVVSATHSLLYEWYHNEE